MLDGVKLDHDVVISCCGVGGDVSECDWSSSCTNHPRCSVNKTLLPAVLRTVCAAALVLRQESSHDGVIEARDGV